MKNNLAKIFAGFMALFIILVFAESGSAQNRRGRFVSKQQVENLLERIEERSDRFSNQLNKSLDRSRLDGARAEDNITAQVRNLENATDELRREYDHRDSHAENSPEVQRVLSAARAVNRIMLRRSFSRQAEQSWVALRTEINSLGRLFRQRAI